MSCSYKSSLPLKLFLLVRNQILLSLSVQRKTSARWISKVGSPDMMLIAYRSRDLGESLSSDCSSGLSSLISKKQTDGFVSLSTVMTRYSLPLIFVIVGWGRLKLTTGASLCVVIWYLSCQLSMLSEVTAYLRTTSCPESLLLLKVLGSTVFLWLKVVLGELGAYLIWSKLAMLSIKTPSVSLYWLKKKISLFSPRNMASSYLSSLLIERLSTFTSAKGLLHWNRPFWS